MESRQINDQTVRNRLHEAGQKSWRRFHAPILNVGHRCARLECELMFTGQWENGKTCFSR